MDGTRDAGHRTAYLEVRLAVTQDADFDCNAPNKDGGKPNMLQQAFNKPAQRRGNERNGGMGVVMLQGS